MVCLSDGYWQPRVWHDSPHSMSSSRHRCPFRASRRCFTHRPGILALPAALLPRCQCWRAGIRAPVSDNNVIKRLRQTDDQLWGGCSRRHCEVCFEVAQRYDDWRWPGGRRLSCNRLQLTPDWINHLHNAHLPLTAHAHEAHQLDVFRAFAVQSDDVAE